MPATQNITWGTAEEAIQSILTMLSGDTREYVLGEMRECVGGGQAALVDAIAASDHIQEGW